MEVDSALEVDAGLVIDADSDEGPAEDEEEDDSDAVDDAHMFGTRPAGLSICLGAAGLQRAVSVWAVTAVLSSAPLFEPVADEDDAELFSSELAPEGDDPTLVCPSEAADELELPAVGARDPAPPAADPPESEPPEPSEPSEHDDDADHDWPESSARATLHVEVADQLVVDVGLAGGTPQYVGHAARRCRDRRRVEGEGSVLSNGATMMCALGSSPRRRRRWVCSPRSRAPGDHHPVGTGCTHGPCRWTTGADEYSTCQCMWGGVIAITSSPSTVLA